MPKLPLILWSDPHVFEPSDLWQTRIDRAFRDRAPRIERIDGGDHVVGRQPDVGLGLSAQRVNLPQSRTILAGTLAGVPHDEQAKIVGLNTARVYHFDVAKLTIPR